MVDATWVPVAVPDTLVFFSSAALDPLHQLRQAFGKPRAVAHGLGRILQAGIDSCRSLCERSRKDLQVGQLLMSPNAAGGRPLQQFTSEGLPEVRPLIAQLGNTATTIRRIVADVTEELTAEPSIGLLLSAFPPTAWP